MKARVFVGNVPVAAITKKELEEIFQKYGKIIGLSLHDRGFAFVQYEKEDDALKAVENENGGLLKGSKLDVKMALDGRRAQKQAPTRQSPAPTSVPPPTGYERDRYAPPGRSGSADTDRSRERYPPPLSGTVDRERSPLRADPYEDRYRDPYRDVLPPPRRDDPYDPYRRPPPLSVDDPYYDRYRDDPYRYPPPVRRDPYADPYSRDPYFRDPAYDPLATVRKAAPRLDCQIVILNQTLMKFAEFVERKLKAIQVFCAISLISEDQTIPQVVENAAKKQCLFAIVVNSQNEVHQSLTVNILHGTPQEHRNMPVDDAVSLIGRSFDAYQLAKREKEATAARPAPTSAVRAPPPFVPPSQDILYLLNLLADKRQLSVDELGKVITYLTDRRDKLLESEGRLPKSYPSSYGGAGEPKADTQKDLQAKILSILNGPGEGGTGGMGMMSQQPEGNGALDGRQQPGGMSSLINLDNPNVQKALDNLIQSGPNLLKTLSHSPGNPSQPGMAMMSRESQHTQPQSSIGRDPYGVPPPRAQPAGMQQMAGGRQPFGGGASAVGQSRLTNPIGMPPRRPPPHF